MEITPNDITPTMMKRKKVMGYVNLGSLISGAYQGYSDAHGIQIDPTFKEMIRYAPPAINGFLSIKLFREVAHHSKTIDTILKEHPEFTKEQVQQASAGCAPTVGLISSVAATAIYEVAGYWIGRGIGHYV